MVSTPLSLSSAGFMVSRLSAMKPVSCPLSAEKVAGDLVQRSALALAAATSSALVLRDQADDLVAALGQHRRWPCWRWQQVSQLRVALVRASARTGATPSTATRSSGGVSAKCLRQHGQRVRQLVGVQAADGRRQIAERVGQLIRRRGALQRDRAGLMAVAAGVTSRILRAQEALGLDRRLGAVAEADVAWRP